MDYIEEFFGSFTWQTIITTGLRITMILLLAWVVMIILKRFVDRMERKLLHDSAAVGEPPSESQKRIETITRLVKQGLMLALWITVAMIVLRELGVEIGPIIASAGIVGLAVGFGAQNLVRDIISGFFIILENQIRVGDVAVINDVGGLVEQINFRTTVLRDQSGTVHIFPNGTITKLGNMTNQWSAYVFDIRIAYKENTDTVILLLKKIGKSMHEDSKFGRMMLAEPEIYGVDMLSESAVIIKGRIRTRPIQQWDVGREFLRRVKHAFDAGGIEIPFPHRSLYVTDSGKPFAVQMMEAYNKDGIVTATDGTTSNQSGKAKSDADRLLEDHDNMDDIVHPKGSIEHALSDEADAIESERAGHKIIETPQRVQATTKDRPS